MNYKNELTSAMIWLAKQPSTLFIGQAVGTHGTFMYDTYKDVPEKQRFEFPVCESFQLQFSIGMSLGGTCPVSIFPRWNFLILATADIVNTLDRLKLSPVIIRTAVGTTKPIYPGDQHVGDFTLAFKAMTDYINIVRLDSPETIVSTYQDAYKKWQNGQSSLIVEVADKY